MTQLVSMLPSKQVLVDPKPAWGGIAIGIAAFVVFVVFAGWIVVQRLKHGKDSDDD
jgi:hypothetical protein